MKIGDEMSWTVCLDGHVHRVRVTRDSYSFWSGAPLGIYVNDELNQKGTFVVWSKWRFNKDGHEFVLSWTGWTAFAGSYELRMDGVKIEPTNGVPPAAPPSVVKTGVQQDWERVELVETQRIEESLGEERRVIDNSSSSAEVRRTMTVIREWSQTITIGDETTTSVTGEVGIKVKLIADLKLKAEREVRAKYSTSTETKRTFREEVIISVGARTRVEVVFAWKQVWQCGVIRAHARDGSTSEFPYRFCLEPTFDQRQVESPA
jgi:hypothetical protein